MKKLDLASPWQIYRQKLAALFELDEQVTVGPVEQSESGPCVTVEVESHDKTVALQRLLKPSIEFGDGGVTLRVNVVDTAAEMKPADVLRAAFAYNRLFRGVEINTDPTGTDWTYLVAEPDVVQFPGDNLNDYRGNVSMLAADAARDVLTLDAGATVCTADLREN